MDFLTTFNPNISSGIILMFFGHVPRNKALSRHLIYAGFTIFCVIIIRDEFIIPGSQFLFSVSWNQNALFIGRIQKQEICNQFTPNKNTRVVFFYLLYDSTNVCTEIPFCLYFLSY